MFDWDAKVLLTELPEITKEGKQKMVEIMFEYFQVPSLHIANQVCSFVSHRIVDHSIKENKRNNDKIILYFGYILGGNVLIRVGKIEWIGD